MPEYLAPGVYVEEVSFRSKAIVGVGTTTTAFVGPTRYGPLYDTPDIITNLQDFELVYGDRRPLEFDDVGEVPNDLWEAVHAFFEEGGSLLYVKRIYNEAAPGAGHARATYPDGAANAIAVSARHPGAAGDLHVRFTLSAGQSVLAAEKDPVNPAATRAVVRGLTDLDVVAITFGGATASPVDPPALASAQSYVDTTTGDRAWRFLTADGASGTIELASLDPARDTVQVIAVTVAVSAADPGALPTVWAGLPLDPTHKLAGAPDGLTAVFGADEPEARGTPIVVDPGANEDGLDVLDALASTAILDALGDPKSKPEERSVDLLLDGGSDGNRPQADDYEGEIRDDDSKTGLVAIEDLEDVSIVAAPGFSRGYTSAAYGDQAHAIANALIAHAERMRYRIAVIDAGDDMTIAEVRDMRAQFDSSYAALYYPWVSIVDPATGREGLMPPSGFVAGIYARNDIDRAVYKAPANEVVRLAIGFERSISRAQQEVLNPEGINCFRFFEGRGNRLWGARTMSSDTEWMYVNLRRYFAYLEHSIDRGTQWAVFEPNGPRLWGPIRRGIEQFLYDEWFNGALLGDKPEQAYFVRCDRSTMTQNDLDNGRLVCLVGVAPLRPAEFVIFRIGQWTADAKN